MKKAAILLIMLMILTACATQEPKESKAKEIAEQLRTQETTEPQTEQQIKQETPEVPKQAEPPKQEIQKTTEETPTETTEPQETKVTKETPQLRTTLYKFLDTYTQKVKSYEFTYKTNKYYVKGTQYKIILSQPNTAKEITFGNTTKQLFYYDTIYMDRKTKTATAYCEGHKSQTNTQCAQLDLYDLAYPTDYKKYNIKLPEDWLYQYLNTEPDQIDANKYYIEGRSATTLRYNTDPEMELNFDPGTGLVLRVDTKKGSQLIEREDYEKLASNLVRDVDLKHRTKAEIPTSEAFYR